MRHGSIQVATKKKASATAISGRKTQALSIRMDARTRYGLELLSREQRRPVAGVAEWCIWEAFRREKVRNYEGREVAIESLLNELALASELERLLVLGFIYPSLMSFEESRMYRVLLETRQLWTDKDHHHKMGSFKMRAILPNWERLRPILWASAQGKRPLLALSEDELEEAGLAGIGTPF